MADKYRSSSGTEVEDEWMLVEMGENGAIAVEECLKEETNLDGILSMKTYYTCDGTAKDFYQTISKMMSRRPKAVLLILSTRQTLETQTPGLISYQAKATDKTRDDLAERTNELLMKAGIRSARQETLVRGTQSTVPHFHNYISDHIPVCQLSVQSKRDAIFHYNLGKALAPLKQEDVLILGLCNIVGLPQLQTSNPPHLWAKPFDEWLSDRLLNNRFEEIIQFENKISHASNVQWLAERLYPLVVVLGAAGEGAIAERLNVGWSFCSHS